MHPCNYTVWSLQLQKLPSYLDYIMYTLGLASVPLPDLTCAGIVTVYSPASLASSLISFLFYYFAFPLPPFSSVPSFLLLLHSPLPPTPFLFSFQ